MINNGSWHAVTNIVVLWRKKFPCALITFIKLILRYICESMQGLDKIMEIPRTLCKCVQFHYCLPQAHNKRLAAFPLRCTTPACIIQKSLKLFNDRLRRNAKYPNVFGLVQIHSFLTSIPPQLNYSLHNYSDSLNFGSTVLITLERVPAHYSRISINRLRIGTQTGQINWDLCEETDWTANGGRWLVGRLTRNCCLLLYQQFQSQTIL